MLVDRRRLHATQVHIQITISQYSYIDYSHEFVGRALARFDRSTFPDHEGTRIVVLRFPKIITPVNCVISNYDNYVCCPKERELYWRTFKHKFLNIRLEMITKCGVSILTKKILDPYATTRSSITLGCKCSLLRRCNSYSTSLMSFFRHCATGSVPHFSRSTSA